MPYRKRYKRKYSRTQTAYYHGNKTLQIASKALKTAYYLKKLINVEKKYNDVFDFSLIVPTSAVIIPLINLVRNSTAQGRVGSSVKVVSLYVSVQFDINPLAVGSIVRMMLILDMQANQALPSVGDILQDTTAQTMQPLDLEHTDRFKILRDKRIVLNTGYIQETFKKYYIKKECHIKYESNTGTITDIISNNLLLLFVSNESDNTPTVSYYSRVRYIDN